MKRFIRMAAVVCALGVFAAPAFAEVKTRDKSQVKFEGMLGRMFSLFGGKGAKEGVEGRTAVKGNRKATVNENTGQIVDLSEEKIYDIDFKKKTDLMYSIFDMKGQRVQTGPLLSEKESIDISKLAKGSYVINISDKNLRSVHSENILVE